MIDKPRFPLAEAEAVAKELVVLLAPACEREPVIAGSIRRRKPDVGDIDLVVIPKAAESAFGIDALYEGLRRLITNGILIERLNKRDRVTWGLLNKAMVHIPTGIPVDIYSTTPENWGMTMVVRTGPAWRNIRMMAWFKQLGMAGHASAGVTKGGVEMPCPDEETVYRLLGWPYTQPEKRT